MAGRTDSRHGDTRLPRLRLSPHSRFRNELSLLWQPKRDHKTGDVFQVQKGTNTGEITAYGGHVGIGKFTPPDGTGNLAATVDTVGELVTAVDDLTVSGGGGGGGTAERTSIYLDAADVAQATFLSASFDEAIVAGYFMEFVLSNGGATGDRRGYAVMTSDEFLLLTVQAAAPTDVSEAQSILVRQADLSGTSTSPANTLDTFFIWRGATDTDFYYRTGRSGDFRLQVYKNVQGGPTGQAGADGAPGAAGAAGADGADATIDTQDRNRLNSVDGLNAKTGDLSINSGTPDLEQRYGPSQWRLCIAQRNSYQRSSSGAHLCFDKDRHSDRCRTSFHHHQDHRHL